MRVREEILRRANLHSGKKRKEEFTAVSMHFQILSIVVNDRRFIEE